MKAFVSATNTQAPEAAAISNVVRKISQIKALRCEVGKGALSVPPASVPRQDIFRTENLQKYSSNAD
jgi:hypothetical protein